MRYIFVLTQEGIYIYTAIKVTLKRPTACSNSVEIYKENIAIDNEKYYDEWRYPIMHCCWDPRELVVGFITAVSISWEGSTR